MDLERVVHQVMSGVRLNPRFNKKIDLVTKFEHTYSLDADISQFEQVFWNLFLNASDAMQDGGRLAVYTRDTDAQQDESTPRVIIEVSDTGTGIDHSILDRIFDPFFSTKSGGTGLGLAMVEKIVREHDGTVRVESDKDTGTMVEVILPAHQ